MIPINAKSALAALDGWHDLNAYPRENGYPKIASAIKSRHGWRGGIYINASTIVYSSVNYTDEEAAIIAAIKKIGEMESLP